MVAVAVSASAKMAKRCGLTGLRFHGLRHSHVMLLLEQGLHPKVVSDRLGHSSISVTLDLYSHPGMDLQRRAAEAFDAAFGDGFSSRQETEETLEGALTAAGERIRGSSGCKSTCMAFANGSPRGTFGPSDSIPAGRTEDHPWRIVQPTQVGDYPTSSSNPSGVR